MDEMVQVYKRYGQSVLEFGLGKAYLRNRRDGRCVFQRPLMDRWICTLQGTKPTACRLFPFRLDPECQGIQLGQPTPHFRDQVVPEVLRIGMGFPVKQKYTTSTSIHWRPI